MSPEIVDYSDALAPHFDAINRQWIERMYALEPHDIAVLEAPRRHIIDPGGAILFARVAELGIVGAVALMPAGPETFELTKMGVTEAVRGRKIGEALLVAATARARDLGAQTLFLLTNTKSAAAIHLYEKLGWEYDAAIMARFGGTYGRANVAMRYPL